MTRYPSIRNAYEMICEPGKYYNVSMSKDGKNWYPARSEGYPSILQRFRCAWMVFTGRADALIWPGQET